MIENVKLISKLEVSERQQALVAILMSYELSYAILHEKIGEHWVENVVITFNNHFQEPKLVIGAHYDNFAGSCGANDNASGVCVLLEIAKYIKASKIDIPIDIVFFDREEYRDRGSEQYVKRNKDKVNVMINIDTCGFGDTILIGTRQNLQKKEIEKAISLTLLEKHGVEVIDKNPGSDDASFEAENIPNISICTIPRSDLGIVREIIKYECNNIILTKEIISDIPEFISTTHNGINDCIEIIQESTMNQVFNLLVDVLNNYQECWSPLF